MHTPGPGGGSRVLAQPCGNMPCQPALPKVQVLFQICSQLLIAVEVLCRPLSMVCRVFLRTWFTVLTP